MTPSIENAKAAVQKARKQYHQVVAAQQRRCKHRHVAEAPYQHSDYGSSFPPMRICLSCGMVEDGWCCGYLVLKNDAARVSREELYQLRTGLHITADHKGPLLRHETTIPELVSNWYKAQP